VEEKLQQRHDSNNKNSLEDFPLRSKYDLILMDCNMPFIDGYETTKRIRQYLFEKNFIQPIISAVTGHNEESYVDKAI
jgi:CheY-like chemotaxis protein